MPLSVVLQGRPLNFELAKYSFCLRDNECVYKQHKFMRLMNGLSTQRMCTERIRIVPQSDRQISSDTSNHLQTYMARYANNLPSTMAPKKLDHTRIIKIKDFTWKQFDALYVFFLPDLFLWRGKRKTQSRHSKTQVAIGFLLLFF